MIEGRTLAHYRILKKLGQGGMGVVYLAEDTKLSRLVALKVLAEELKRSPESLARFRTEARAAAALSHPNIATLYSVEEADGQVFITMEYVDGLPLRKFIPPKGLELKQFFQWAVLLADAFSHAHERGVVHRDIKPDNILIAKDQSPKVLDFGLARFNRPSLTGGGPDVSTLSEELTRKGAVMGTVVYMSPEQAEGKPVDARSDIFSLGVVMYEMLTGSRPFRGDTPLSVLSSIIKDEPASVTSLRVEIPHDVARIIRRSLQKDLSHRYQAMLDVRNDLEEAKEESRATGVAVPSVKKPGRRRWAVGLLAGLALIAGGVAVYLRSGETRPQPTELVRLTTEPGLEDEPSWSPDGRSIVYTSDQGGHLGIWMKQVGGERAVRLGNPDVDEAQPAWSPDGSQIAFVSTRDHDGRFGPFTPAPDEYLHYSYGKNGDVFVMPALGGTARKIAEHAYDPSWAPDGKSLAFRKMVVSWWRPWIVSIEDGRAEPVKGIEPAGGWPAWSPDGRWLACVVHNRLGELDVYVVPAKGGTPARLTDGRNNIVLGPAWSRDGRWIIFPARRDGPLNLWRVPFRENPPGPAGPPERVTTGPATISIRAHLPTDPSWPTRRFTEPPTFGSSMSRPCSSRSSLPRLPLRNIRGSPQTVEKCSFIPTAPGVMRSG